MKLLVMQMKTECNILKTKPMKKLILIALVFTSIITFSQNQESNYYINSDVSLPSIKYSETFFYTEYEFMLNEKHITLAETEKEQTRKEFMKQKTTFFPIFTLLN